jgi:hypothetical protein
MTHLLLLGQQESAVDIGAQISAFLSIVLTPTGAVLATLGLAGALTLLLSSGGLRLAIILELFLLTFLKTEERFADNTLIEPFQTLRTYSRLICFALLVLAAGRALLLERGSRNHRFSLIALVFLVFQIVYTLEVASFYDLTRGVLGVISISLMFIVFYVGMGRMMQDVRDAEQQLQAIGLVGFLFIGANLMQLAFGYNQAVLQRRMVGISGNAQQFASVCSMFLLVFTHLFSTAAIASLRKILCALSIGLLALFILWSGSRTGLLCSVISVLLYYRHRVGRLIPIVLVGAGLAALFAVTFGEDALTNIDRFLYGKNTREAPWADAWSEFLRSPVFGQLPGFQGGQPNGVESSYLRALALMGVIGGVMMAAIVACTVGTMIQLLRVQEGGPSSRAIRDMAFASLGVMLVSNTFEGFFFGLLTFPVMLIYFSFAVANFALDHEQTPETDDETELNGIGDHSVAGP